MLRQAFIGRFAAAGALAACILAPSVHATTVNLQPDGRWYAFDIDEFAAQSGNLEWIDGTLDESTGYVGDGSALTFTFTLATAGKLTIVDAGVAGDEFRVNINGSNYSTSPSLDPDSTSVGSNFDAALSDGHRYSYLNLSLDPGTYTITGALTASALDVFGDPLNATVGGIQVSTVPVPAAAWLMGSALVAGFGAVRRRQVRQGECA